MDSIEIYLVQNDYRDKDDECHESKDENREKKNIQDKRRLGMGITKKPHIREFCFYHYETI